ncbi:hypothetical protein [Streptomyces sp. B22F1]|uniref:hypothetical protein n=1 Tax=Streptomyces sp. B22F1 TaxID=3153566 RepID=UPI00325C7012
MLWLNLHLQFATLPEAAKETRIVKQTLKKIQRQPKLTTSRPPPGVLGETLNITDSS